jgi:hypothetical protein
MTAFEVALIASDISHTQSSRVKTVRLFGAFLLAVILCATAAAAEQMDFGQFRMDWPKGFAAAPNIGPPTFKGPNGERLTFTIDERRGRSSRVADKETMAKMVESTSRLLQGFERDFGRPLWQPPREQRHENGDVHLSSAFKAIGMKTGYTLVHAVVSTRGAVAVIVLEGQGDPAEADARYRPVFDSARWQ